MKQNKKELEPLPYESVKIKFSIKHKTPPGHSLYLSRNTPTLGAEDLSDA